MRRMLPLRPRRPHVCTHAQTDEQTENIMPAAHLFHCMGEGMNIFSASEATTYWDLKRDYY